MICPFASWKPINANYGGKMTDHLGFVIHVQQGNGSLYGFFSNPNADVSAHFWCSKTGTLEQYLDTDTTAWAEAEGNKHYTSCEFEGFDTEPMTQAQLERGAQLIDWLASIYHFPIVGPVAHGSPGVTPHCNPDGTPDPAWGNHPCPGTIRLGQIPAMVKLAAPPTPVVQTPEENMIARDNKTGGYWVARPNANVYAFNGAPYLGPAVHFTAQWGIGTTAKPVTGIVSDGAGGFTLSADNPTESQPNVYHITSDGTYAK